LDCTTSGNDNPLRTDPWVVCYVTCAITQRELAMKVVYILLFGLWLYWSFMEFQRGNKTGALIYLGIGVALLAWRMKRLKA
jgi:hypothetical protein